MTDALEVAQCLVTLGASVTVQDVHVSGLSAIMVGWFYVLIHCLEACTG